MKLLKKYNSVQTFSILDGHHLCIKYYGSNILSVIVENSHEELASLIIHNLTSDSIYVIGDKIYYGTSRQNSTKYKYELHVAEFKSDKLMPGGYCFEDASIIRVNKMGNILSTDSSSQDLKVQYISILEGKVIWSRADKIYKMALFDENYFISKSLDEFPTIRLIENQRDRDVWSFETETIANQIGDPKFNYFSWAYIDDRLIAHFNSGEILFLSMRTGEVLDFKININRFGKYGHYVLDKNRRQLIKIFRDSYHVYNIDKNEFEIYDLKDIISAENENTGLFTHDNEFIYYINSTRTSIISFNKSTRLIEWKYSIDNSSNNEHNHLLFYRIELLCGKLYVIDNNKTLYVFGCQ